MTRELAAAASDLSIGREMQKRFLPLETDKNGNKLSTGRKETQNAVFFGYYEGAKEVSGDYFDYRDIDGRYYAIIKCDVAGKGIPAAMIMIQVATMFVNYFKDWQPSKAEMHIEKAVYQINDFIETLDFHGRFAAFTLCIFDSETGNLRFCNAGDNIINIFDSSEGHIKRVVLPQTPAAGALPNTTVAIDGGYQVQSLTLDPGDILLLYTDGIEDSKRMMGQWSEQMGLQRVCDIVNAVMNCGDYNLYKQHEPKGDDPEEELRFNFSGCGEKVEDLIMALAAVEKMFRCRYDPRAAGNEWALVDKKIDAFLKDHFLQYRTYCAHTCEYPVNNSYLYYTHLREDEQYDDLAMLGIKRK
jgi:hypothetical protein